jgi:hypothetical protein
MPDITNHIEFEHFLERKPISWAQILACRIGLRVLAWCWPGQAETYLPLAIFRSVGISWSALNLPMEDLRLSASDAIGFFVRANIMAAVGAARDVARAAVEAVIQPNVAVDAAIRSAGISLRHDIETWKNISADANWLEQQSAADTAAEHLGWQPLWLEGVPDLFDKAWQASKNSMQTPLYGVRLWADWYQRRIDGRRTAFDLPIVEDQLLQLRIFTQPNEFWRREPAIVHDEIRIWMEEERAHVETSVDSGAPEVPAQRPNELQTFERDGRVARLQLPPQSVDSEQESRRRAAWQATRVALTDYQAAGPVDNWPRLNRMTERLDSATGKDFESLNPVGLGVQAAYLQQYALRADEFLLADRAADLVALNTVIGSFLPQFPEWIAYLADADARPSVPAAALTIATEVVAEIKQNDGFEADVKTPLVQMREDAIDEASAHDPDLPVSATYRQRFLVGLDNALATAAKIALQFTKDCAKHSGDGVKNAFQKGSEQATLAFFWAVGAQLMILAGAMPEFAWLLPLLAFLKNNAPKS